MSYSIKAKQKSRKQRGSAGINTREPKSYSIQIMGALTMNKIEFKWNKVNEGKQTNEAPNYTRLRKIIG
jgi:hypothetical protein